MPREYGPAWKARRELYAQTHKKICAKCGSTTHIVLHHKTYEYPMGEEPDSALVYLCNKDHSLLHKIHRRNNRRIPLASHTDWFLSDRFVLKPKRAKYKRRKHPRRRYRRTAPKVDTAAVLRSMRK